MSEAETNAERRMRKERRGLVVRAKADSTVVVAVTRRVRHPRYNKFINVRKRYAVHDTVGVSEGDYVRIRETKPLSKTKRWRVIGRVGREA